MGMLDKLSGIHMSDNQLPGVIGPTVMMSDTE